VHNEVSPAQFELAPIFEELNLAVDHNMIVMEFQADRARDTDSSGLLHENPFAVSNGSGNTQLVAGFRPTAEIFLSQDTIRMKMQSSSLSSVL